MNQKKDQSIPDGLENIKRVVVLMFENRSFDHLFGDFSGANGLFEKDGSFKKDCYNLHDPLSPPDNDNNPKYFPVQVDPYQPLAHDFTHDFGDGMMPDLFGPIFKISVADHPWCSTGPFACNPCATYTSGYTAKDGPVGIIQPRPKTYPDTNSGFFTTSNNCRQQGLSVMSYFRHGTLRILHKLAEEFVLCDNFHCDMPGHTKVNRCFMHCATTANLDIDDTETEDIDADSIFNLIPQQSSGQQQPAWQMYCAGDEQERLRMLDTRYLKSDLQLNEGATLTQFTADCMNGTLPAYSFVMCWLPNATHYTDTSMHPNSMMQGGENMLAAVYNTLRNSPCWEDTLLVINFDENGGLYDHVFPPPATPPEDRTVTPPANRGCCLNKWLLKSTFDFSLLGPRVPALLISPWLSRGIDNTQYQNTSVLRFVIDNINAKYGANVPYLTARDTNAPSLDTVFSRFGLSVMRTDCPEWITPYQKLPCADPNTCSDKIPYSDGTLTPWIPPAGTDQSPPVAYINELLNIYIAALKGHPESGKKIEGTFTTIAEVNQYIAARLQAAAANGKNA